MPLSREHKRKTRARVIDAARRLFNRRGFAEVSIDDIMGAAGLTRGGFYNHFKNKDEVYAESLRNFAAERRKTIAEIPQSGPDLLKLFIQSYVSRDHLDDLGEQCPLMALSSDVARAGPEVRQAYQRSFEGLLALFEEHLDREKDTSRRQSGIAALAACVGAMVLARTVEDSDLADEICRGARVFALEKVV